MNKPSIAILPSTAEQLRHATLLAEQLHLPLTMQRETDHDYLLLVTTSYIGLQKNQAHTLPLYIDFAGGKLNYRGQHISLRKEAVARALGLKTKAPKKIIDATGGLARDTYVLASLGFSITLLERSPIIYTLISDAITRGLQNPAIAERMQRITLIQTDAITYLHSLATDKQPDLIYLDPMFPERKKSALPKQDMLIFHDIVGDDLDADELLNAALSCAKERVVVKRPRKAPPLSGNNAPSFSLEGSSSRFDIYLI